jgi:MFS family permease
MVIIALSGLGMGLSDSVLGNYFYDAFDVDALQRGWIELPRELPGVLVMFVVSALAFLGDIRLSLISQALKIIGIMVMALFSPTFSVMLFFLFINSLGMHMFMPLYASIGMSLAKDGRFGTIMGRIHGVRQAFTMIAAIMIFVGFRFDFFSFTTPVIVNFLIAGILYVAVFILLVYMRRFVVETKPEKSKFVIKKIYTKYYLLAMLFGARKQIMYVFGPWVLIELLGFGADNMALLIIAGAGIGVFFMPLIGKWVDRFGNAKIMIIEAAIFLAIYLGYGIISAGLHDGWLMGVTAVVIIAIAVNIADRMTIQFGMVRSVYMRSIAETPEDVTPTLATGMALDHVVSIASAVICGFLWWELGPQYVFIFAGVLTVLNLFVAKSIGNDENQAKA